MRKPFLEQLEQRVLVADGAMGTMLYARGISIKNCFDELNLSQPQLVREIHQAYVQAGADIIQTNTFGANAIRLGRFNLAGKVAEINRAGVQIAREAAGDDHYVAGSIGPLGVRLQPLGKLSFAEAHACFREQTEALAGCDIDLIVLETFGDLNEIREAIFAVREVCHLPLVAHMSIDDEGRSLDGSSPVEFARRLTEWGADVVGVNCSVGPVSMLEALEKMRHATAKPLAAQPNAGKPRNIDGRNLYLVSAEYMADYSRRFIDAGARIVGGCCGTTPEHIKWIRNYVRATTPGKKRLEVNIQALENAGILAPIATAGRSRLARKLVNREFITLVEILPPRGSDAGKELASARLLIDAGADAINIPDGPRASARMSNLALAVMLQREGIESVLHYCCRDRNVISMQSDLLGGYALGLRNLILITGDPPKLGNYTDATAVFDIDSIGLTRLANNLNRGLDLGGNAIGSQTGFLVGVGANPGAPDLEEEMRRLRLKIEAGADYVVTQPVFDLKLLESFLEQMRDFRVPVIAGIWPLVSFRQAEFMQNELRVAVPEAIRERMRAASTSEAARQEGLRIALEMLSSIRPRIEGVQISVLGRNQAALELLRAAQKIPVVAH